tara:strand:- start:54 stop:284 length:231 start_codon:yes stop_codon:yes gene_type:complete
MGEIERYKATLHSWDEKRSYLIVKKVFGRLSNGAVIERYEVLKRWSAQDYGSKGMFTDSLKGSEYTFNELKNITKI